MTVQQLFYRSVLVGEALELLAILDATLTREAWDPILGGLDAAHFTPEALGADWKLRLALCLRACPFPLLG